MPTAISHSSRFPTATVADETASPISRRASPSAPRRRGGSRGRGRCDAAVARSESSALVVDRDGSTASAPALIQRMGDFARLGRGRRRRPRSSRRAPAARGRRRTSDPPEDPSRRRRRASSASDASRRSECRLRTPSRARAGRTAPRPSSPTFVRTAVRRPRRAAATATFVGLPPTDLRNRRDSTNPACELLPVEVHADPTDGQQLEPVAHRTCSCQPVESRVSAASVSRNAMLRRTSSIGPRPSGMSADGSAQSCSRTYQPE